MSESRSQAPELLEDLSAQLAKMLVDELQVAGDRAKEIGLKAARKMASHWGGQLVYFPKGAFYELTDRDGELYAKFNGNNHAELAREFDRNLQTVYRIVATMRAEDIAHRQKNLFGENEK